MNVDIWQLEREGEITYGERRIIEWQYSLTGHFFTSLFTTISLADESNLSRLHMAFPREVDAFLAFSRKEGWWEALQKKVGLWI